MHEKKEYIPLVFRFSHNISSSDNQSVKNYDYYFWTICFGTWKCHWTLHIHALLPCAFYLMADRQRMKYDLAKNPPRHFRMKKKPFSLESDFAYSIKFGRNWNLLDGYLYGYAIRIKLVWHFCLCARQIQFRFHKFHVDLWMLHISEAIFRNCLRSIVTLLSRGDCRSFLSGISEWD